MPEGSEAKTEGVAPENQKGGNDRNLLYLIPHVAYSTGSIIEHWALDPRISEEDKKGLRRRRVVQSFLARFMKSRTESALKNLPPGDSQAKGLEKAMEPVATLEYGGKKNGMKLYLGAQYSFFAALYLGEEPATPVEDLLDLISKNKGTVTLFNQALLDQHLQGTSNECQVDEEQPQVTTQASMACHSQNQKEADSLGSHTSRDEHGTDNHSSASQGGSPTKRNRRMAGWLSWMPRPNRVPTSSIVQVSIVLGICIGVLGGSFYLNLRPKAKTLTEMHNEEGPASLKPYADLSKKVETKTELYGRLLALANDPKVEMSEIEQHASALLEDKNPGWVAKGQHALGLASFQRGDLDSALSFYLGAEANLLGLAHLRMDLRAVYLEIACCQYYLNDAGSMHDYIKKGELVVSDYFRGKIQHLYSKYWLLEGDLSKAIEYGEDSIRLALIEKNKYHLAIFNAHQSMLLTAAGQIENSFRCLKVSQGLSKTLGDVLLDEYIQSYDVLWAERMELPVSGINFTEVENGFEATKNYIASELELALKVYEPARRE